MCNNARSIMAESDARTGGDGDSGAGTDRPPYRVALAPVFDRVESLDIDPKDLEATIAGGLAGGFMAVFIIHFYDTDMTRELGAVFGMESMNGGWIAALLLGVLFALPFGVFVSQSINSFVSKVMALSRRNDLFRKILVPLLKRSAYTTTTYALGNGYGIAIGVVFGIFLMPAWLTYVMGVSATFPAFTVDGILTVVAWLVYGGVLGLVYGLIIEY